MIQVLCKTYNPFQENTYLLYDASGECIIIDPGCWTSTEEQDLKQQISRLGLKPVGLYNTHCHLDHVFGNAFVEETYGLELTMHAGEIPVLDAVPRVCNMYGIPYSKPSPNPGQFLQPGQRIGFGQSELEVLFTPGHSPASVSFFSKSSGILIAGDVLFSGSIGRTDLPGGDLDVLMDSIRREYLPLGDEVVVYPGHGSATTIGHERKTNPFLLEYL